MKRVRESFNTYRHTARKVVGDVVIFSIDESLASLTAGLDDLKDKFNSLNKELPILRKYDKEEFDYYTQMIEASEKVLIYAEAISLSEPGVRMTVDNNQKLTKLLSRDTQQSEFVTPESSTREDMIYNYNLAKLISAMEKVLRERVFVTDHNKF